MERKKITFDSFIRGVIGCMMVVGILMLVERLSGVLLPFFYRLVDCLYGLSVSQVLPIQTKAEKPHPFHFCALFLITVVGVALFYLLVPPMVSEIGRMNDLLVSYLTNGGGSNVPKTLSEFVHENLDLVALNKMLSEENILAAIKETVPKM